jgi:hypothetical protein
LNPYAIAAPKFSSRKPLQFLIAPKFEGYLLRRLRHASTLRPHRQKEIGKPPSKASEPEKDDKYWEDKKVYHSLNKIKQ